MHVADSPAPFIYLRPILASDGGWTALEWQSEAPFTTKCSDLAHFIDESDAASLADLLPLVITVDPVCLEDPSFVDRIDKRHAIFVLPDSCVENEQSLARCKELRSQGLHIGIHLERPDLLRRIPVAAFDTLSLNSKFARQELSTADLNYATDAGFRKIATHVTSHEMFGWLAEQGFDWCDGQFLTKHKHQPGVEPDLTRLKLLRLFNLVKQDGDTREIEGVFREEPKLSYNLLRLVNSAAVGTRTRISNFSQAITLLGRRQLQRWLQLLIYANNLADGFAPNPLMQLAAARGRQMELLSAQIVPPPGIPDLTDNAFMTGLFSLLDILINLPMKQILTEVPLHDEVVNALITPDNDGVLGQLLSALIAGESGNLTQAGSIFSSLGISPLSHAKAQVESLYWAGRINIEDAG